jgi:DNA ligase-1
VAHFFGSVRHPNYEDILNALLEHGFEDLFDRVPLAVGIPLSPMLGSITRSLNEVYTRLGTLPFTAEAKLDGQRVQIHARISGPTGKPDGGGRWVVDGQNRKRVWVRLFSRHLEDMTEKYPDVCEMVASMLERGLPFVEKRTGFPDAPGLTRPNEEMLALWETEKVTSFVMDAEVVAVDKETGAYRTFQELSNRAKKDVKLEAVKVVVGVFAFDLMLLNDTVSHCGREMS